MAEQVDKTADRWVDVTIGPVDREGSLEGVIEVYPPVTFDIGAMAIMELSGYRTHNTLIVSGIKGQGPFTSEETSLLLVSTQPSHADQVKVAGHESTEGSPKQVARASTADWWHAVETFTAFHLGQPAPER